MIQPHPIVILTLALAASVGSLSVAFAEGSSRENPAKRNSWAIEFDELEYRYTDSGERLAVWDGDFSYGSDALKFLWVTEGEWAPEENVFEEVVNRLLVATRLSEPVYVSAGIRVDTPEGPDRTFGAFSVFGTPVEQLDLESNLYVGEDSRALFELEVEYELAITRRVALTGTQEALFALSEDARFGIGEGLNSTETALRLSYAAVREHFSPYVGVIYEREYGDTADLARAEGEGIEEWVLLLGARLVF